MSFEEYTWLRYYEDIYHRQKRINNALAVELGEITAKTKEQEEALQRITGSIFWKALSPARKIYKKVKGLPDAPAQTEATNPDDTVEGTGKDRPVSSVNPLYEARLWYYEDYYRRWIERDPIEKEYKTYQDSGMTRVREKSFTMINVRDCATPSFPVNLKNAAQWIMLIMGPGKTARGYAERIQRELKHHLEAELIYGDEDYYYDIPGNPGSICRIEPNFKPDWSPDTLDSFFYLGHMVVLRTDSLAGIEWLGSPDPYVNVYDLILKVAERLGKHYSEPKVLHIPQILFHNDANSYAEDARRIIESGRIGEILKNGMAVEKPGSISGGDDNSSNPTHNSGYIMWKATSTLLKRDLEAGKLVWGHTTEYMDIKWKSLERRGLKASFTTGQDGRTMHIIYEPANHGTGKTGKGSYPMVSVLILSKDHPGVLKKLLTSFVERTDYNNVEFIVVDNGSKGENRLEYERVMDKTLEGYPHQYIHKAMEFNFSALCNLAATYAEGELLLFMNDDIEVLQRDWLKLMAGYAGLEHVGAVGAKLLYANTELIQHAGITSMEIGPSHKLVIFPDDRSYYYGKNIVETDMLGVTAACLMIDKDKFNKAGGFDESFPVAYNDVEFSMRLARSGLVNLECNGALLYHHESLTRGGDEGDSDKWIRLLNEKKRLYQIYPEFLCADPYYNPNLIGNDSNYLSNCDFGYNNHVKCAGIRQINASELAESDGQTYRISVDFAGIQSKLTLEEPEIIEIRGWSFLPGQDYSLYGVSVILNNETSGIVYRVGTYAMPRKDLEEVFPAELNNRLCGFITRMLKDDLAQGKYRIGIEPTMLNHDLTSAKSVGIVVYTENILSV